MTSMPQKFVIFDLETTGLDPHEDRIIEMGAIKVDKQKLLETLDTMSWQCFVKQSEPLSGFIKNLTGITDEMLKDDETEAEAEALQGFFDFVGDYPLYAYNEKFDVGFVNNYCSRVYMGGWYGYRGYGRRWR